MKKIISVILGAMLLTQLFLPVMARTVKNSDDFLTVTRTSRHMHSRLSKKYTGYEFKIKSNSSTPIEVGAIALKDNVSGKTAYLSVKRTGVAAAAAAVGWGAALAVPTLTLSLFGSVIATPFIILSSIWGNVGADMEGKRFDKVPVETVLVTDKGILLKTMASHNTIPIITVVYKNPNTSYLEKLICN